MNHTLLVSTMSHPLFNECSTDGAYLEQRLQYLRDCGIEALDFNIDNFVQGNVNKGEIDRFWDKDLDELYRHFTPLKHAAQRTGMVFSQMHAVFPLYVEGNEEVTEYLRMSVEKNLAIAAFLNCPAVVVHPHKCRDKEEEVAINLALYRRLMPFAKQYGVKICLENLFQALNSRALEGVCSTPEEACWYIDKLNEEAGSDVFGFCLDIGHATLLCRDLKHFILKLGRRLTCLHIHDSNGSVDSHVMPFTQGLGWTMKHSTDWDGMLEGLREIGYRGNLSFEAFRSFLMFPEEVHTDVLKLYSAIGRYFRDRIANG